MFNFHNYYISQIDESDCGVASLAMLLKYYGSDVSLSYLRNIAKTDKDGTTALGIVKTAQQLNFETKAIKADMRLFDIADLHYPFIAHVIKDNQLLHYYVVISSNKKYVTIADPDPSVKVKKISKKKFASEWSGVAIFVTPSIEYIPIKERKKGLFSLFNNVFKNKALLTNIVLSATLMTIISILGSYFIQGIIDTYIPNELSTTLGIVAVGLLVFYMFNSIFMYSKEFLLIILGQRLSIDIILGYIRHVFNLPMEFFATRKTGEIISRFNDASKIIDALASAVLSMFLDVGTVFIIGIVLAFQSLKLFLVTLSVLPVYILVILIFANYFEKLNSQRMESNATVSSSIIEDVRGIETIKSLNSEQQRYQHIDIEFVDFLKKSMEYSKKDILQQAIKSFIQLSLSLIVLWIGSNLVIYNKMSLGQLMTYNALLVYFTTPLQNIINLQPKLQAAKVANNRLNEIYLVKGEHDDKHSSTKSLHNSSGNIQFNDVSYRYGFGKNVLNDINLTINSNKKVTFVGESGSGKSTLVKLLVNFFEPTSGNITIDNQDVQQFSKKELRSFITYVPQNPYVFSGTILENLKLGNRRNIYVNDIFKACEIAMIKDDIEKMPLQYDTILDEEGHTLSGGQKQRLTIARALLSPAKVLILDESTSGLDTLTEKKLIENLIGMSDKTIIFIAHRLAVAEKTDTIFVLNNGTIVEQGTHQELLSKKGFYYKLVNN